MDFTSIFSSLESTAVIGTVVAGVVLPAALMILMVVSWWIIYDKMGEKGWKCLIPFYGKYTLFACVWEGKIYFISLLVSALSVVMSVFGALALSFSLLMPFLSSFMDISAVASLIPATGGAGIILFSSIFSLAASAIQMILNWRMVKCFGYGIGFFLGITFLPVIFCPVLAFGNAYFDYY